ncbi:MAG: ABC transporter substrate-binding protein [Dehalococcoidia bacterium]|nr:ABC transporter substrate-binding protein [Dehalococcoidia bacterium]
MIIRKSCLIALLAVLVLLIACAPQAVPSPAPTQAPIVTPSATVPPSIATTNAPSPISQQDPWAKVIEAAKKEGKLTVYAYWTGDTTLKLQQTIKDKYGITVEFIGGRGATQLERLLTEKRTGAMTADVFISSAPFVVNAQKSGLTVSLPDLPALKEKDVWVLLPDAHSADRKFLYLGFQTQPSAINTKLLTPATAPHSYKDLISPAWKGKMLLTSPDTYVGMYSMFVPLINQGVVSMDFIKALGDQDTALKVSADDAFQALARGEKAFFINATSSVMAQYVAQGAPIKAVAMDEGTTAQLNPAMAAIAGGPDPNAAKVFVNWLLTKEGQDVLGQAQSINSIRKDVRDYTPADAQFTARKLINTSQEDLEQQNQMFSDKVFSKLWVK